MLKKKRIYLITILGFLIVILLGAIILSLPMCNNRYINFEDALFVSTSTVCVNGFSTVSITEQFSTFGYFILLLLVQIGALGFMSFVIFILTVRNKKISFSDTMLAGDFISEKTYSNIKKRIKNIFKYTFTIEITGAVLLSFKFASIYGVKKGIWYGFFHSVTAFCNSGLDLIEGESSLNIFRGDLYINIVITALMFLGGIGFLVIEDILACIKERRMNKLTFQTKLILYTNAILLVVSVILIKIFEPKLKIMETLFTSVALRTTGFTTIDILRCKQVTKTIFCILMFIGGAPGSTSGGIGINTLAILVLTVIATLKDRKDVVVFYRRIDEGLIKKAITITILSLGIIFIATIFLLQSDNLELEEAMFHTISAFSEVGLSYINLESLSYAGKAIILIVMFTGRVGPIAAIGLFLIERKAKENVTYADANIVL